MTYRWHSHVYPECGKFRLPASLGKVDILEVHILKVQDYDGDVEYACDHGDDDSILPQENVDPFVVLHPTFILILSFVTRYAIRAYF